MQYATKVCVSRRHVAGLAVFLLATFLLGGCGTDPADREFCGEEGSECPDGQYCDDAQECVSDCTAGEGDCADGEVCNDQGQCVSQACDSDGDCGAEQYCTGGECVERECDPQDGSRCGAGEECSGRGTCVMAGECLEDADCDDPPSAECNNNARVTYDSEGTCLQQGESFECEYPEQESSCGWGCEDGECLADPCSGDPCNDPPPAECGGEDGDTLLTYGQSTCSSEEDGECSYPPNEQSCPHGCTDGACEPGPCTGVACDNPPEDSCDGDVVVTYADEGSCESSDGDEGPTCNYDQDFEHCAYTGASCENASCTDPVQQTGELVITEMMADPEGVADRNGEWFEVYNPGSEAVDLQDWSLTSEGNAAYTIEESVSLEADERVVLARDEDPLGDGSLEPDHVYEEIYLANGSDWLRIKNPDGEIADHVFYEAGAILAGHSRKLDPAVEPSASANDAFDNWCPSLTDAEQLSNDDDYGSPGEVNEACTSAPCSEYECQRPEGFCSDGEAIRPTRDQASCEESRFNNPACDFDVQTFDCTDQELCVEGFCEGLPSNAPDPGDLVITEMMGNPATIPDSSGEWIEVYNSSDRTLSLFSLILEDDESGGARDAYTVVNTSAEIPSNDYAVFVVETDSTQNGGIEDTYHYQGSHLKNSPQDMTIRLVRQDGTVIDEAHYGSADAGVAQQLDVDAYQGASSPASNNDTASNWCSATSNYDPDNTGTPGDDNHTCD